MHAAHVTGSDPVYERGQCLLRQVMDSRRRIGLCNITCFVHIFSVQSLIYQLNLDKLYIMMSPMQGISVQVLSVMGLAE
jgi:hypothetical protein